jgi:acyl-CoA thioesterase FadM
MARIRIQLPEEFRFTTSIPIRISDLNYGGHVGNDTILTLLHESRMQFLKSMGYTEMDFEGTSLIMSDVGIEFKSEVFYGDVIKAYVTAAEFSRVGFDVCYMLVNEKNDRPVAHAKTGMVCYDYKARKIAPVPQKAIDRLSA